MTSNWKDIYYFNVDDYFDPEQYSHAQLPTPICIDNNILRVFFAVRDNRQISSIYFSDLKLNGEQVLSVSKPKHVMNNGPLGCFDEHGVFPASIIKIDDMYYMYYVGWNKGSVQPMFYSSIGLAVSEDCEVFKRYSSAPIMSRSWCDPCLVTSPNVYKENNTFQMTYVSGIKWTESEGALQSHYHIKTAQSHDGINWQREGNVAIDFEEGETNIARSSVAKSTNGSYEMWFSYVHSKIGKYRLGYASSSDGQNWNRNKDISLLDVGGEHYKEMLCYPQVIDMQDKRYMLFNGDNYGKKGFGIAVETIE